MPGRALVDENGKQRVDLATGKKAWASAVIIPDKEAQTRFQPEALAAVDRMPASRR